jgi:hypothetical protein
VIRSAHDISSELLGEFAYQDPNDAKHVAVACLRQSINAAALTTQSAQVLVGRRCKQIRLISY